MQFPQFGRRSSTHIVAGSTASHKYCQSRLYYTMIASRSNWLAPMLSPYTLRESAWLKQSSTGNLPTLSTLRAHTGQKQLHRLSRCSSRQELHCWQCGTKLCFRALVQIFAPTHTSSLLLTVFASKGKVHTSGSLVPAGPRQVLQRSLSALLAFLHRPGPLVPSLLTVGGTLLVGEACAAWQSLWSVLHENLAATSCMTA